MLQIPSHHSSLHMQPSRLLTARFARRNPCPIPSSDRLPAFLYAISAPCRRRTSANDGTLPLSSSPSAITDLLSSFSRAGLPSEARHLLLSLKSPTAFHYNTVIHSLAVSNHASDALRLFDDMLARGIAPNAASFTILVKIQSFYLNDVDSANEVFESMSRHKVAPDPVAYSTLIAGFCRFGRIQEAWKVLDEMIERKCTPNINAFTSILRAYCMKGMIGEAKRLIFLMEKNGFVPDTIIYSVFIEGLCRIGEFDEVERVLGECDLKGWKPNEVTYNSYMNGLCKWGRVDEAFRQLEVMQSRGLYPDNVTVGILFDCLCRDDSMLCTAKCLLERNFELGWYVDVYYYNSLMNRLCETGNWSSVLKLLMDMVKKGIDPDTCTFTIVIRSLCLAGKFKNAICIICSQGFDADIVAFNTLIHWLSMAGMVVEARHMFDMMNGQNIVPNKFTYFMMIDCLCKSGYFCEAIKCVLSSLNGGFLPDLVTRLNYWLIKDGKFEEMLSLFDEILARSVAINGVVVSSTIKAFCRKGFCLRKEFNKVCLILDKMLEIR